MSAAVDFLQKLPRALRPRSTPSLASTTASAIPTTASTRREPRSARRRGRWISPPSSSRSPTSTQTRTKRRRAAKTRYLDQLNGGFEPKPTAVIASTIGVKLGGDGKEIFTKIMAMTAADLSANADIVLKIADKLQLHRTLRGEALRHLVCEV